MKKFGYLSKYDLPAEDVKRICYIIGHHHTYKAIDGIDFQILVEADARFMIHQKPCKRLSQALERSVA